jgi:TatD DNase family protein
MHSLIDTHSHIYLEKFAADRDQVIERSRAAGVEAIIVPATNPSEFDDALALADRYPEIRVAIGVHPHHAAEIGTEDLDRIERLAVERRVVAIGEIGLDYHYDFAPREVQHEVFRRQLRIAKRLDLPAAIHNRESDEDLLRIIEEEQDGSLRFQLHCFSSSREILRRALALGSMISFTGNITYSRSALDDVVRAVPDERIMIETDAPYLTPVPYRGKRNEPGYVGYVAAKIAELRDTPLETIKQMTTDNARRFFRLTIFLLLFLPFYMARAQGQPKEPVRLIDTTTKPIFNKWFGFGGHLGFTSLISGSTTEADGLVGSGFWLTVTPLQSFDIDWVQLDFIYTHVVNDKVFDSAYVALQPTPPLPPPPNNHTQIDISLRLIANSRNLVSFYGSVGIALFHNEFGIDRYFIENNIPVPGPQFTDYKEDATGLGGAFGISVNINTPYALIAPTAEWRFAKLLSDRPLPRRQQDFFVSQPRLGLLIYPNFSKLFGM